MSHYTNVMFACHAGLKLPKPTPFFENASTNEATDSGRDRSRSASKERSAGTNKKRNREAGGTPKTKKTKKTLSSSSKKVISSLSSCAYFIVEAGVLVLFTSASLNVVYPQGRKWDDKKSAPADLLAEHKAFLSDENLVNL